MYQTSFKADIPHELKDTKEILIRHLLMTVCKKKRTDEDKHSIYPKLVPTLTSVINGSVLIIIMYYYCKERFARMFLRLAKTVVKQ